MLSKTMSHRVLMVTVVSFLVVALLAACAPAVGPEDSADTGEAAAADTSGMTGREAALASASEEDRTLIVAVSQDLSTLDWDASGAFPRMTETQGQCPRQLGATGHHRT